MRIRRHRDRLLVLTRTRWVPPAVGLVCLLVGGISPYLFAPPGWLPMVLIGRLGLGFLQLLGALRAEFDRKASELRLCSRHWTFGRAVRSCIPLRHILDVSI